MLRILEWVDRLGTILSVILFYLGVIDYNVFVQMISIVAVILIIIISWSGKKHLKHVAKFFRPRAVIIRDIYGKAGQVIMDRRCKICNNPRRAEIEKKLLEGVKYEDIRDEYDISLGAISKHFQKHMPRLIFDEDELKNMYENHRVKQFDLSEELFKLISRLEALYNKLERLDEKFFGEGGGKISAISYVESVRERRNILADIRETLTQISELKTDIKTERDLSELLQKLLAK
ncbi:MAG: hypothetical protein QW555_07985 [Nitrososphaerota archaeon]